MAAAIGEHASARHNRARGSRSRTRCSGSADAEIATPATCRAREFVNDASRKPLRLTRRGSGWPTCVVGRASQATSLPRHRRACLPRRRAFLGGAANAQSHAPWIAHRFRPATGTGCCVLDAGCQVSRRSRPAAWHDGKPESPRACCHLSSLVAPFRSQHVELDLPIVCRIDDSTVRGGAWRRRATPRSGLIGDPLHVRLNPRRARPTRAQGDRQSEFRVDRPRRRSRRRTLLSLRVVRRRSCASPPSTRTRTKHRAAMQTVAGEGLTPWRSRGGWADAEESRDAHRQAPRCTTSPTTPHGEAGAGPTRRQPRARTATMRNSVTDQLVDTVLRLLRAALTATPPVATPPPPRAAPQSLRDIRELSWEEFERLIAWCYRQQGYDVVLTGSTNGDGGVDLLLRREGALTIVQCKQWRAWKVGAPRVRDLYGAMMHERAAAAILVTSGEFTWPARAFARGKPIRLIAGGELARMIDDTKPRTQPTTTSARSAASAPSRESPPRTGPPCPRCGASLVRRTAHRGERSGMEFWGCPRFPRCRGTLSISG